MATGPTRVPLPNEASFRANGNHVVEGGLLRVNMKSRLHPIYKLIRDARKAWDNKLERQSQSLEEATVEYRRRYGRQPPRGFDKWWKYVVNNNVTLPDEYDQVDRDLLPFRALTPEELTRRLNDTRNWPHTYTLQVKNGSLHKTVSFDENEIGGARERMEGQAALIEPVMKDLEDFTAVYWVHDNPRVAISYHHRQDLTKTLRGRQYFDENEELDPPIRRWSVMCPPDSRMGIGKGRMQDRVDCFNRTPTSHTFIADHQRSMDLCEHPENVPLHGALTGKHPGEGDWTLNPLFVLSKTTLHADILGVSVEQVVEGMRDVPWEEKREEKVMWRGRTTGIVYSKGAPWRTTQRPRLIKLANDNQGEVEILGPSKGMRGRTVEEELRKIPIAMANEHYLDIAFVEEPIQCDASDGTCQEIVDEYRFAEGIISHDAALHYKYIIDVDGNAWSARFQRLLSGGSLIFKATIFPEWWTDRMQAWVHYVPIQLDYSDLYDVIAFFRGDITDQGGESALAKEIAEAGKAWARANWRQADMTAYMFRLYLEWARLLAPQTENMDFT
ncbi:hypothetical protein JCM24511_10160 [Saitozyma sp. JCM 24511]|nr:hypothetical protein JCM24511_10160 [Saitozyma sp. JCM 24511]